MRKNEKKSPHVLFIHTSRRGRELEIESAAAAIRDGSVCRDDDAAAAAAVGKKPRQAEHKIESLAQGPELS